jgi:ubiquitin-conjugating enzyme E2 O
MRGEFVKRNLTDLESAVVVESNTKVKLESLYLIGYRLPVWVPWNKLANALALERRDKVVYQNWIGTVEEVSVPLLSPQILRGHSRPRCSMAQTDV